MAEKTGIPNLRSWHFEASEDIMTKFRSQGLHIVRIKYWNASGIGSPPSLIPALWNIGILLHKQATQGKHFCPECIYLNMPKYLEENISLNLILDRKLQKIRKHAGV